MTIGELADLYERLGDREVPMLENPHSYRGYYDQLAFELSPDRAPARDVAALVRRQIGETFTGYKGGNYTMRADTAVWIANWGSTGRPVVDVGLLRGEVITGDDSW